MSLQNTLNNEVFNYLPNLANIMSTYDSRSQNSIKAVAVRECLNSRIAITDMDIIQLNTFETSLINNLKFRGILS